MPDGESSGGSARRASGASKSRISPAASNLPACSIRTTSGCGFGRPVALGDAGTFRRLFGLDDRKIETAGLFDLSGQILGLATVAWVRPGTAEVALIIRSDLQRRGLGATLLANVIDDARDAGFNLLIAYVGYGNLPMRRLARRFGFEFAGTFAEAELVIRR